MYGGRQRRLPGSRPGIESRMARDERPWRILIRHRRRSQYSPISRALADCAQAAGRTVRAGESAGRVAQSRRAILPALHQLLSRRCIHPAISSVQGSLPIPGQPGPSSAATQQSSVRSSRSMDVNSSSSDGACWARKIRERFSASGRSSAGVTTTRRITRMGASRLRPRSEQEPSPGSSMPISLPYELSMPATIVMPQSGIDRSNSPSSNNADSTIGKIGGRRESSRSRSYREQSRPWLSRVKMSNDSMSPLSPSGSRRAVNNSHRRLRLLILWQANSGVRRMRICPNEAIASR